MEKLYIIYNKKHIDTGEFDAMLVQYNLRDRRNEEAIAYAHEKGMGEAIMGPVGGGRLTAPSERVNDMVGGARITPEIALRFVLANPNASLALSWYEHNGDGRGKRNGGER